VSRRHALIILAGLAAVALAAYLRPLLIGDTFALRDHLTLVVPARDYLARSLAAGRFPEWWDAVGMGIPFAANPMHGATYPPAWLVAALPMPWGADFLIALHAWMLGVGTAFAARRLGAELGGALVAGGVMLACGYTTSMAVNGVPLIAIAWIPWLGWAADRVAVAPTWRSRGLAGLGLAALFAVELAAGDPAAAITSGLMVLVWVAARSPRPWAALAMGGSALAAALPLAFATVLPALHLVAGSERAGGIPEAKALAWSMHPLRALEWVWPHGLGNAAEPAADLGRLFADSSRDAFMGSGWSISLFLGAPVLLLAVYGARGARDRRRLALAACGFVVLALGAYTPLYSVYRAVVVPERLIRFPERHLIGWLVPWVALAGVGFSRLFAERLEPAAWRPAAAIVGVLAAGFGALVVLRDSAADALIGAAVASGARLDAERALHAIEAGGLGAVIAALVFALAVGLRPHARWLGWLAGLTVVGHLIGHGWTTHILVPRELPSARPAILLGLDTPAASAPRIYRHPAITPRVDTPLQSELIATLYETAIANTGASFGFAYVPGYDPAIPSRLKALWERGARHGRRLLWLFDVELAVVNLAVLEAGVFERVPGILIGDLAVGRLRERRPRAFVAPRWGWGSDDEVSAALIDGVLAPGRVWLAGEGPTGGAPGEPVPCALERPAPEHVIVRCDAPVAGYLVLLDSWAPGWRATVAGRPAEIERADVAVRAVRLDAGPRVVEMSYRTPGLRVGAGVAAAAWLGLAAAWWALARGKRRARSPGASRGR
jgi:hypothetical protein